VWESERRREGGDEDEAKEQQRRTRATTHAHAAERERKRKSEVAQRFRLPVSSTPLYSTHSAYAPAFGAISISRARARVYVGMALVDLTKAAHRLGEHGATASRAPCWNSAFETHTNTRKRGQKNKPHSTQAHYTESDGWRYAHTHKRYAQHQDTLVHNEPYRSSLVQSTTLQQYNIRLQGRQNLSWLVR